MENDFANPFLFVWYLTIQDKRHGGGVYFTKFYEEAPPWGPDSFIFFYMWNPFLFMYPSIPIIGSAPFPHTGEETKGKTVHDWMQPVFSIPFFAFNQMYCDRFLSKAIINVAHGNENIYIILDFWF